MTEQRKGTSTSSSSGAQTRKEVSTSETVAMSSPTSTTMMAARTRPKMSYESKSSGFQQKGALPIPASDPDHAKRSFALLVVATCSALTLSSSSLLWLHLTGSIVWAMTISMVLWLVYFAFIPRIAAAVDNWFNRNRPYCVLHSREEVMCASFGFASLIGFAFVAAMLA